MDHQELSLLNSLKRHHSCLLQPRWMLRMRDRQHDRQEHHIQKEVYWSYHWHDRIEFDALGDFLTRAACFVVHRRWTQRLFWLPFADNCHRLRHTNFLPSRRSNSRRHPTLRRSVHGRHLNSNLQHVLRWLINIPHPSSPCPHPHYFHLRAHKPPLH